ncbi:major facilitator superfamily domain-containing protein [Zopfochytrium polystomum]|nr:major facilitator superfamily domain-containing protein [Zopfochytrium polystomum]
MSSKDSALNSNAYLEAKGDSDTTIATASSSTDEKTPAIEYTAEEERRVVRKIDLKVVPILTVLYLLSFLDRSNIGNARIEGLVADIGIKDYSFLLSIFFVGYVLFEVPSNIILKRTSPPFWLPTISLIWGVLTVVMGLVHDEWGIYITRFLLGAVEAGLFPGSVFVFSMFYPRKERHYRVSMLLSGAAGWAWIFIMEGLLTVVVSVVAYWLVPTYPQESTLFTPREKAIIKARMQEDHDDADEEEFHWDGVWQAFRDPFVYLYAMLFHGFAFALYTVSLFMPSIISDLGYASWQAQLMTVPPYAFAFLVTMTTAHVSFLVDRRLPFIIGAAGVALVGYIVQLTATTAAGKYAAVFITAAGVYAGNALLLSLPSENVGGQTKRATALAMQIAIGDVGAIAGTLLYRQPLGGLANSAYKVSHGLTVLWLAVGVTAASLLWVLLAKENRRRDEALKAAEAEGEAAALKALALTPEERRKLGDRRLDWRYHI